MSDPTFSVIDPRAKVHALEETAYVQRELGDDGLYVVWDGERQKFCILDRKAPGGPDAAYVMLVQFDGPNTPVDNRTIETLRKLRRENHGDNLDALVKAEQQRQRDILSRRESAVSGFVDDFRYIGKAITPSVGWRDRSAAREQIRKKAQ